MSQIRRIAYTGEVLFPYLTRWDDVLPIRSSLASLALLCLVAPFAAPTNVAAQARPALIPQPREFSARGDISLRAGVRILVPGGNADDRFAAQNLRDGLRARGVRISSAASVRIELLRDTSALARNILRREHASLDAPMFAEGYVLVIKGRAVYVIAHTAAGVFYGAQTLKQLERTGGTGPILQGVLIRDWPAMRWRGIHDDLSRGPVPTLAFQEKQIRTFAAYKINVYSPYFENTMQYASNPLPALPGGSISAADAKTLVTYARRYHVTIIPEQEAFGHLHKVLLWQKYSNLAEIPYGEVLAPGQPGSLHMITEDFDELAGIYTGPFLHIGADETFQLGQGQTAQTVKQRGWGQTYIDYLTRVHQALAPLHRRLLFWGDMAMNSPELVPELPHDMIAVAWEYDPEPNGYAHWIDPYTNAHMETWVSPGINNWRRVWPDYQAGLLNIQGFTADGQKAGCTGMLNTVWDDDGEGLFLQDWYGILFAAAAAWQPGSSDIPQFQRDFGPVFHGDQSGDIDQAQQALIDAQQLLDRAGLDESTDDYFWVDPWSDEGQEVDAKLRPIAPEVRLDAEQALTLLAHARAQGSLRHPQALDAMDLGARRLDFLALKFQLADQIATTYRRLYNGQSDPAISKHTARDLYYVAGVNGLCEDLRDGYNFLRSRYSAVWLMENRPYWLRNVTDRYDVNAQLWIHRSDQLNAAREQWEQHHTLPPPQQIGIPAQAAAPAN